MKTLSAALLGTGLLLLGSMPAFAISVTSSVDSKGNPSADSVSIAGNHPMVACTPFEGVEGNGANPAEKSAAPDSSDSTVPPPDGNAPTPSLTTLSDDPGAGGADSSSGATQKASFAQFAVSVPDGGSSVALLGFGLLVTACVARRRSLP